MNLLWKHILLVASGGAAGSVLRFLIYHYAQHLFRGRFPVGTFFVNVTGCLLIGFLYGLSKDHRYLSADTRLLLMTGFCGGFTTFSAFSLEGMSLLQQERFTTFFFYFAASMLLGLAAAFVGAWLAR